ncbi:MAG: dipeptidase [Actinobacteria bacterium]|nr:dipeptidase [Actinomycetota bacterium]
MVTISELRTRVDAALDRTVEDLAALVRIPSVSADTFDQSTLDASAAMVRGLLEDAGLTATVSSAPAPSGAPGRPAVLAARPAADGLPTVLLYAHHDVQPPGPHEDWDQEDPFEPVVRGERLYARGSADDKAGVIAHVAALRALGEDLAVGVRCFVEGEEEVGSPSFVNFLTSHRDALAADVIVVLDSSNWKVGVPALTTSLRGLVECQVELRVAEHALHSGMYGGPVLDAPTLMCRLLASLHDENGDVAVPGLLHREAAPIDYPEADFRADAAVVDGYRLAGTGSIPSRLWTRPALGIVGFDATPVDRRSNTIAPTCRAALSLRVAPGQDPAEAWTALESHLRAHVPFGAQVTITPGEQGPAFLAAGESPAMRLAHWALREAWGVDGVEIGVGGSIPFIADLAQVFPDAEILVTGIEDPDTRAHSGNESIHLGELRNAILAEALMLARLSGTLVEE